MPIPFAEASHAKLRVGRAVLIGAAALIAAVMAGLWVLPGILDWNRYRESIASLATAVIGRPVAIDGNVTLHLLPQPTLTASGLRVNDPGDGVQLTARELRLQVALGPLLAGRVDARELTLRGAELRLPWPPPSGALTPRPPAWLTGLQGRIEASRVQVGNFVLGDVDASLGTDSDTGTLSAAGVAAISGRSWRFIARLARPDLQGTAALDVSLDGQGPLRDTGGTFSGVLSADGALSGHVTGRGPDLSQLMPAPAVAWRGDGRLIASGGLAVADELALEVAGSPAHGAVALRIEPTLRLDVTLAAGRLDLDAWTPVLTRSAQPGYHAAFTTGIDLSAEAATLAGGTLRQLRALFDLEPDGVVVRSAESLLPGDARITLSGRLPGRSRPTLFEGVAELAAPDLRGTLRWLEPFAPSVLGALPEAVLRTGSFSGKLAIDPAALSLFDLHGTLDGAALQGGVAVRIGPRTGISAGLLLDRLVLDPWLPRPAALLDPVADYRRLAAALAAVGFDADLKLQIRQASWAGLSGPLSVDGQCEAGRLTLRRLEAAALGIRATLSGTVGEGGRISEGRLDVAAQDVSPLRALLPADLPGTAGLLRGPAAMLIQLSGPPDVLAARAAAELADLRLEASPTFNLSARRWSGPVTMHHPGAPRLLELLGVPGTGSWLGDGSFSLIAQLNAAPGRMDVNAFELVAGAVRAGGQLSLAGPILSGRVVAETLAFPAIDPHSADPLPVAGLRGVQANLQLEAGQVLVGLAPTVQALSTQLSLAEGRLAAKRFSAKLAGGTLAGSAEFATAETPRLALKGTAQNVAIAGPLWGGSLDVREGVMDATLDLSGEGYSPAALLSTLSGKGEVRIRDAVVTGFDLGQAASALEQSTDPNLAEKVRPALTNGTTSFSQVSVPFTARQGVLSMEAAGTASAGTATLTGSLDLLGAALDARLALRPGEGLPDLVVRLAGPAADPVRTPELAGLARWLAERP